MTTQKEYWDKKINEWSSASYGRVSKISFIEKVATHFRSVEKRKDAAVKILSRYVKGRVILDLGCGLGEFTFDILRYKPKRVLALDISRNAVCEARLIASAQKVNKNIRFEIADVSKLKKIPACDLVVGLGFIDYLHTSQLKKLFKKIGNKPYLFSYFEKKASLFNLLHKIYLTLQNCPGAYKYSKNEMLKMIPSTNKMYFFKKDGLMFITNMKILAK